MKKVIALGASVIAGLEFSDFSAETKTSPSVWPALYARDRGVEFVNLAYSGCAVQYVLRTLLESITQETEPCFYIIHWPPAIRFEYADRATDRWVQVAPNAILETSNMKDSQEVKKAFYTYVNSQLGDKWQALLMIYTAMQALDNSIHTYAMSIEDDFLYSRQFHNPPYVDFLQDHTENNILLFEGLPWLQWVETQKFPIGPYGHPLEEAHYATYKYLEKFYDDLAKK